MRATAVIFLVPLFLALWTASMRAGRTAEWDLLQAIGFRVPMALYNWLLMEIATWALWRLAVQGRLRLPLSILLIAGSAAAQPAIYVLNTAFVDWYQHVFIPPAAWRPLPSVGWMGTFEDLLPAVSNWTVLNLVFVYGFGMPRFGFSARRPVFAEPPPAVVPLEMSSLLARLPARLGHEILSVSAEQHYVRVVTRAGEALVLYRLSDAVRELAAVAGARVHRSHWVARAAIAEVERGESGPVLVLVDGRRIPVSRTYREAARSAGMI